MNKILLQQCQSIIDPTLPPISNISNLLAVIFYTYDINWVGIYDYTDKHSSLTLGPFQGKVACTRIPYGHGVVGTCAKEKHVLCVEDVHTFTGHIACDSNTNSELVIPLIHDDQLLGVLDLDSLHLAYFSKEIQSTMERVAVYFTDELSRCKHV
ncbi:GAF domain-containing protein [Absicoccus porci]|jgi:L-methionine (R)-S-oxide reductase|uniref:GAF domain-containing protein n=1 Tax=Absicoccus porci TaxID=2486576 RepID=UPI00240A4433|nr:GAF domain-containing protein [Absicoccus porci]MDD6459767.1 GAF domain-containing protein [Absicoccus porci]